jgi:glycosyltransferase involved in cell wall biosynthesis
MSQSSKQIRLAYLVTHPIQYQAPLLRRIACDPGIELSVFFRSDFSTGQFFDREFQKEIAWDTNLLCGYRYTVLPCIGRADRISVFKPLNYSLLWRLKEGKFDLLWIHGYGHLYHIYAAIAAKFLGVKVLIRDEATLVSKSRGKVRRGIKKVFFLCFSILCDGFLAIGTMNREYYTANGIPNHKIFDVPYAVDNGFFQQKAMHAHSDCSKLRDQLSLKIGRPVILYASKLSQRKRAMDLLEAYREVANQLDPKPYLLFVGDGELRKMLMQKVKDLGLDGDVHLLGFRNQSELPRFYDLCDVFVLPSVFEPWGLAINEAMNAGCPIIASDQVGSARDLVYHGRNGFIFQSGNVQELAGYLIQTLRDPNVCRNMGAESKDIISRWDFEEDLNGLKKAIAALISSPT